MSVAAYGGGMGGDGGDEKKMREGLAQVLDFVGSNDEDEDGKLIVQALSLLKLNPNPNLIVNNREEAAESSCMRRGISRKSKSFGNLKEMAADVAAGVKEIDDPLLKRCRMVTVHEISPLPNIITHPLPFILPHLIPQHHDDDHNNNQDGN